MNCCRLVKSAPPPALLNSEVTSLAKSVPNAAAWPTVRLVSGMGVASRLEPPISLNVEPIDCNEPKRSAGVRLANASKFVALAPVIVIVGAVPLSGSAVTTIVAASPDRSPNVAVNGNIAVKVEVFTTTSSKLAAVVPAI